MTTEINRLKSELHQVQQHIDDLQMQMHQKFQELLECEANKQLTELLQQRNDLSVIIEGLEHAHEYLTK